MLQGLADGSFETTQVGYIEAHAAGDATADVVEAQALSSVYGGGSGVLVGTVKPNIGHLEAAAGIASLVKTVLVVREGQIPGNLDCSPLNPACKLPGLAFPRLALAHGPSICKFVRAKDDGSPRSLSPANLSIVCG